MKHCVCQDTGPFRSDVKGVLIGKLGAALKIERCDNCEIYPSDEEAADAYVKKHGGRWASGTFWFPGGPSDG